MQAGKLVYTAAPGERNQVFIQRENTMAQAPQAVRVSELFRSVIAGAGCRANQADPIGAFCLVPASISVAVGDNDDVAGPIFDAPTLLDAGSGNDYAAGPVNSPATILGGPGNDRLVMGKANDIANGGSGNDLIYSYPAFRRARDQIKGGAGNDQIFFPAGKADGGPGNDQIFVRQSVGSADISGGAGKDHIRGGPRKDTLSGGSGRDRIEGDSGNDRIFVADGSRDRVDCGPGRDRVQADKRDVLQHCEVVTRKK